MRRNRGKLWGVVCVSAILFAACGQENTERDAGNIPTPSATAKATEAPEATKAPEVIAIDAAHFQDEVFRAYLAAYADKNQDGQLEYKEIEAIRGLGNVGRTGGLDDWIYKGEENEEREKMLKAIESMEGIQYLWNLLEIRFEGEYALKVLPLDNPKLTDVWVMVDSLEKFSVADGSKLQTFCYQACEAEEIPWAEMLDLRRLELSEETIDMTKIMQYTKLKTLKLSDCEISAPEHVDFSVLPELTEFVYFVQGWQEDALTTELHLENNAKLTAVTVDASVAERIYLQNYGVECQIEGNRVCEVQYTDMAEPDMSRELPEGSIWLSKTIFPDEAFWRYLYYYVDSNQDYILTPEERGAVYSLGSIKRKEESSSDYLERVGVLEKVQDFEGIQYLENLQEIVLSQGDAVRRLVLNHPKLQRLNIDWGLEIQEFSIQNAESLTEICINVAGMPEIDWKSMKQLKEVYFESTDQVAIDISELNNLQSLTLRNVILDFEHLAQNKYLQWLNLRECMPKKELEFLDLSVLGLLRNVEITVTKTPGAYWFDAIRFGSSEKYSSILLTEGITGKVNVANKGAMVGIRGDEIPCEIVYEDELPENMTAELPQGAIWNVEENIADFNLRSFLYGRIDGNRDGILRKEERAVLKHLCDDGYDYDRDVEWNEENEWRGEDDISWDVRKITSLKGLEYFPELVQIQLETMELSSDVKEIVITNPKLEIFDLRFNGNVELIDLTACKNLRICVVDTTRDVDFVQETSPTILLPEHLEFYTVEGMDCVIGEPALERFGK
ncbi:MAG: hypothetical protein IJY09_03440 [Lachnospiraceae bacterium]|nr:hypothetical protein [Lachnospiraceae bacterium]